MRSNKYDLAIVGGGILGLATAHRLLEKSPGLKVLLIEKENRLAAHQTGNNSGVLHSGLYYKPGSAKASLCVSGLKEMIQFCRTHGVPHEICGKIVLATHANQLPHLETLWQRGHANGMQGLRRLNPEQIKEIEPHANGVAAIHVPQEGIVDYPAVCETLARLFQAAGGVIQLGTRMLRFNYHGEDSILSTTSGDFPTRFIITCGGLHADLLAKASGCHPGARVIPFRGEFYKLKESRQYLVRHLIYPVPDRRFPFLGVHLTRLIHGGIEAGPNAVLALAREGYKWTHINPADLARSLLYPGLWRFLARYPSMCTYEIYRSLSKSEFARSIQQLVPEVQEKDLIPCRSGVRAQPMLPAGHLVEDFYFEEKPSQLHVLNAPSPAATASLALGSVIASKALSRLGCSAADK